MYNLLPLYTVYGVNEDIGIYNGYLAVYECISEMYLYLLILYVFSLISFNYRCIMYLHSFRGSLLQTNTEFIQQSLFHFLNEVRPHKGMITLKGS